MAFGPHGAFIVAAYGAGALALAALILWVVIDYRTQRRALASLEAQGIVRRSSRVAEDAW
jgi:heme exporter protein D